LLIKATLAPTVADGKAPSGETALPWRKASHESIIDAAASRKPGLARPPYTGRNGT
jgi:hypothetical protein